MALSGTEPIQRIGVLLVLAVTFVIIWRLDRPNGRWGAHLRKRFVMGVPWGTIVVISFVLSVYLFLQGGFWHWFGAVTIPFSAWSYFYPLGMVTAAFSHSGAGHLIGNLTATVVIMPLAEYVFGHYPRRRGTETFTSLRTNPWARALLLFPLGVLGIGLLTALFSWGPVIGFSGVVFAAVGFAVVRYPLYAVLALLTQDVVLTAYRSWLTPIVQQEATQRFVTPGWAGIAVQGHTLGLFLGAVAAVLLFRYRGTFADRRPSALRLWFGAVLASMSLGLWALWWVRGGETFVLFRAAGLAFVLVVGVLIAAPLSTSDRSLVGDLTARQLATVALVVPLLIMAAVAVPISLTTLDDASPPPETNPIEIRDYTVVYAENVPNQMINVVDVSLFGETTKVNTSGVIVISDQRHIWSREVPPQQLSLTGRSTVVVGGVGWREVVVAKRTGWSANGGGVAYQVRMGRRGEDKQLVFQSEPATVGAVLRGLNVSVVPSSEEFVLRLSRNNTTVASAPIPAKNESVLMQGMNFTREKDNVVASYNGTEITVAKKETYKGDK